MVLLVLDWDWVPGQIGRVGIGTTRTQLRSEKEQARRRLLYELPLPTTSPTCLPKTQIPITPKHTFQVSGTYWAVCLHFGSHGTLQRLLHPLSTNTSFIPTYVHTQNPHMAPRSYIGATGTYRALYLHCESQKLTLSLNPLSTHSSPIRCRKPCATPKNGILRRQKSASPHFGRTWRPNC